MITFFDNLRTVTLLSVALRMMLSMVCGGIIGVEREYKRRSAGFRTHILICLGATMTTLTSQFLSMNLNYNTDPGRLGAQVVAGIGFIGAGTIIVTKRRRVKGLTTAAGLWAAAIIGLCLGAGFYEGAILATMMILVAEMFFSKLEYRLMRNNRDINLYVEYVQKSCLDELLRLFLQLDVKVVDLEITRSESGERHNACAIFALQIKGDVAREMLVSHISGTEGVLSVEEL